MTDAPLTNDEVMARLSAARPEALHRDEIDFRIREEQRAAERRIQIDGKGVNGHGTRWNIEP